MVYVTDEEIRAAATAGRPAGPAVGESVAYKRQAVIV